MRKHWLFTVIAVTTFTGFSSCSDDDDVPTPPETPVTGAYILNTGGMGSNNSSLQLYDPRTNAISGDIFEKIMPANLATQPMIYISTVQRCI